MSRNFEESNNDYLDAGNPSALNLTGDEVTLSAWIRLEAINGENKIFAKWADDGSRFQYLLSKNSDDECLFAIRNGGGIIIAQGTSPLSADIWYHIAGVYDGSNVLIYCNGALEDSTATSGNMSSTTAPVRIGAGSGGAGTEQPFDGDIGHCALWGVGLSASEIKSLSAGINPLKIRSQNRLFYAPLNGQDPELDVVGGLNLTVNGATKSEEPPIPNSIIAA